MRCLRRKGGKVHHRAKDITGLRVGYLTAESYAGSDGKKSIWNTRCVCGKLIQMPATELQKQKNRGIRASCGCRKNESISASKRTHGMSRHPAYAVWRSMLDRCRLPTHQSWANYGGRGIQVCSRWQSFPAFWEDMGPTYREDAEIERKNNAEGYFPENCRWATRRRQANNRRPCVYLDTPFGRMTVSQAARRYKLGRSTLAHRLAAGWPPERLFDRPLTSSTADPDTDL